MAIDKQVCTVITGASQGLGKALAEECAGRGRNLVLAALPGTGLPEVARWLERAHGIRVEHLELDLTADDGPDQLARFVGDRGLAVEALLNNAGVGFNGRFGDSAPANNETTIRLNMLALVSLTRLLLSELRRHERSHVLNVASLAAWFPMPWLPVYSSSKSFVLTFSLALREELRGTGVSVSVLCPNGIRTNRSVRELIDRQGLAGRLTCQYPDEVARAAMRGLLKGKAIIVPGRLNQFIRVASGLVPRTLSMGIISRRWNSQAPRVPRQPRRLSAWLLAWRKAVTARLRPATTP